ncbi:helix-turn-helix transcriptional regulator [Clostridium sp. AM58-1XD]|uniref:helix-turn-helix domain-containing protein n=1 Tax=Clostridium sp. AM58-1XD TaxID=2292307 RepID=UPI0015F626B9|nr:helix-turn-helix transcriptional regulator [Clostridium sp. AM58-1XD]
MGILNDRIKEMRTKKGYTLAYVAELLGIKEATMQRYESGEIKNIKHETIAKLAEIFNCTPAYLMGWEDSPNPEPTYADVEKLLARNGRDLSVEQKMRLIKLLSELD